VFSVSDNGIGVPEDKRDEIFEPFKRLRNASDHPGTGLGLATCKKIITRHQGEIWCSASQQGGTNISFRLPVVQ
jgi:signal transduction histidine kinase